MSRRWRAATVSAVVIGLACAGCTTSEDGGREPATTTLPEGVAVAEVSPELGTEEADSIVEALDEAETERDMCMLVAVLEGGLPVFDDPDGAIRAYNRLAEVVTAADEWVPAELVDDWEPITDNVIDGAASVVAAEGDLTRAGVAATFGGDDLQRSVITVSRWALRNC